MSRQSGALRILLYNWPVYVATWTTAVVVLVLVSATQLSPTGWILGTVAACGAVVWSIASLAVSLYIYDRSALVSGTWVPGLLGRQHATWATIHAGLDAEVELDAVMPGECLARLDIFDPRVMTSPSIVRARARTRLTKAATRCSPTALALNDASCDAVVVAFHGTRDPRSRRARRILRRG